MFAVDQARDPYERLFAESARMYDNYQQIEYRGNFERRRGFWEHHYRKMRAALIGHVMQVLERGGKRRSEMNLAIVGPGFDVMNHDFDEVVKETCLARTRSIVVMDFSTSVVKDAVRSLLQAGVPEEKILGMQYDITNGLGAAYQDYIHERMSAVVTEEDLDRCTEEFTVLTIEELRKRRNEKLLRESKEETDPLSPAALIEEGPFPGGLNRGRKLALTVDGKEHPLDIVSLQMVLAATGAAAEAEIWSRFQEIVMSDTNRGARVPGEETDEARRQMYRRIHAMIAHFNTAIAESIIQRILDDNERAKVLAVTDVSTQYESDVLRTGFPRLNLEELQERLDGSGIGVRTPFSGWDWRDDFNHYHRVMVIQAERVVKVRGNGQLAQSSQSAKEAGLSADEGGTGSGAPANEGTREEVQQIPDVLEEVGTSRP